MVQATTPTFVFTFPNEIDPSEASSIAMEKNQETYLYLESASGHMVRVPESEAEAWIRGQEKLKNGDPEAVEGAKRLAEQLTKRLFGDKRSQRRAKG